MRATGRLLISATSVLAIIVIASSGVHADLSFKFFPNAASTQFADVTGDGRADAIAIGDGVVTFMGTNTGDGIGIVVRPAAATGDFFGPSQAFTSDFFAGELATVFTDVTGDGKADGVAIDQLGLGIRASDGTQLRPRVPWIGRELFGTSDRLPADSRFTFANVDGRPGDEAIAISPGIGFFPQVFMARITDRVWVPASVEQGTIGTVFADVDGDGRADAVQINQNNITVQKQLGTIPFSLAFGPPIPFTSEPFFGNLATHIVDVDGNGMADAVAVNDLGILVRLSNGTQFLACTRTPSFNCSPDFTSEKWTSGPFVGEVGTYFARVAKRIPGAPRPVDVIAVSRSGILARRSSLIDFAPASTWSSQPFFGEAFPIFVGFRR